MAVIFRRNSGTKVATTYGVTMRTTAQDEPVVFKSGAAFRAWLARNHASETALLVRLYKVHALDRGMGYADALDEALAYGWIDGVRRRLDDDSLSIRFSPRTKRSIWSKINIAHVERLIRERRMTPAGLAVYQARDPQRSGIYSFEKAAMTLAPAFEKRFRAARPAWKYWEGEAPWYRKTATHWVMSAKREETRERRLATLIECCAEGTRIGILKRD